MIRSAVTAFAVLGLLFLVGCEGGQHSDIVYVAVHQRPHGYDRASIAFGQGVHAYEVTLEATPRYYYFGLVKNSTRHPQANTAAIKRCIAKYSNATVGELSACRDGVLYARQTLELITP